jgi:hypothetical protein
MSEYLRYVFRRSGLPTPQVAWVRSCGQDWAVSQIISELETIFPKINISIGDPPKISNWDLLVLPYISKSFYLEEWPASVLRPSLGPAGGRLLMLYGLSSRQIVLIRAESFWKFFWKCRLYYVLWHFLLRLNPCELNKIWIRRRG